MEFYQRRLPPPPPPAGPPVLVFGKTSGHVNFAMRCTEASNFEEMFHFLYCATVGVVTLQPSSLKYWLILYFYNYY